MLTSQTTVFSKTVDRLQERSLNPILEWGPVKGATEYKIILRCINLDGTTSVKFDKVVTTGTSIKVSDILEAASVTPTVLTADALYRIKLKAKGTNADVKEYYFKATDKKVIVYAHDFNQDDTGTDSFVSSGAHLSADGATISLKAPVRLPEGVQITKTKAYYSNAVGTTFIIHFSRDEFGGGSFHSISSITTENDGDGNTTDETMTTTDDRHIITNDTHDYYLYINGMDNNCEIQRYEIYYECDKMDS